MLEPGERCNCVSSAKIFAVAKEMPVNFTKQNEILYLCDRRKCEKCSYPECYKTSDVNHAKNFAKDEFGCMVETHKPVVVFKAKYWLRAEDREKIRQNLIAQLEDNVIFVDETVETVIVDDEGFVVSVDFAKGPDFTGNLGKNSR